MNKTKQFIMLVAISVLMLSTAFAQLPTGSYAKDISMKRLTYNGSAISDTTCTIYEHTNIGKPVIMDISAIWCSPCYSFHQSGVLETLYNSYGPHGTNELMVYFVEGDQGSLGQLNGNAADQTNGYTTQGNWVSGTQYPILPTISPNTSQVDVDYAIRYFPTVYLICPDRSVTEVGTTTAANIHSAAAACPVLTTNAIDAKIFRVDQPGAKIYCGSFIPKISIQNYGTTPLTSAKIKYKVDGVDADSLSWSGTLNRLEVADLVLPTYSNPNLTYTTHTVTYTVESPNNDVDLNLTDNTKTLTISNVPFSQTPITQSFILTTFPPANWSTDDGTDGSGWTRSTAHSGCSKIAFYEISSNEIDYLMLPPVTMTSVTAMNMTFKVAYALYSASYADKLELQVSSNCGATWTSLWTKSGSTLATASTTTSAFTPSSESQWRTETVNLDSYAGQEKVLVRFKATSKYGNNCYVDDINLDVTASTKNNELVSNMNLYPNPTSSTTNLEFYTQKSNAVNVLVINAIGEVVYSLEIDANQGFNTLQIPSDKFQSGVYFVSIKGQNCNTTQKLVIQK
jgi:hypothetical protein